MSALENQATQASSQHILDAAKGGGISFIGTMIEFVGRFLLGFVLARFMGDEQYGLYSLTDSAVYLLIGIAPLGLSTGLLHFIPVFRRQNDAESLSKTLKVGFLIPLTTSLLIGAGFFVFARPLAENVFREPRIALLLQIAAISVPAGTIAAVAVATTQAFKQMHYKVIAQDIILTSIKMVLTLLLAIAGLNAVKAITAYSIAMVVSCMVLLYLLGRLLPRMPTQGLDLAHVLHMFKFSFPVYLAELLTMFGPNIRTILLGALNTVRSAGVFTVAARVTMVGNGFFQSIVAISMPIVSELYMRREYDKLGHFYQTVTKWTLSFNLPFFILILLFSRPILALFGPSFVSGSTALIILALNSLVTSAIGICGVLVIMTENVWLNTFNSALRLIFTLALSVWLIPTGGVVGAAIATAASLITVNLILTIEVFILFKLSPYNRNIIKPLIAGMVSGLATWALVANTVGRETWIGLVVGGIFLIVLYGAITWLLGLSADDRLILSRVLERLNRLYKQRGPW